MNSTEPTTIDALAVIEREAAQIVERIVLIEIRDPETFALAVAERGEIKRRLARIDELMSPIVSAAHLTWKTAVAKREALRGPYLEADKAYSRAMGAYEQEQDSRRREVEEAAHRERDRLEAAELARVKNEERRFRTAEEDLRLKAAVTAEMSGDTEAAERILAAPIEVPLVAPRPIFVPPPAVPAPKATGVTFRDNWSADCRDLNATIRAAAAGNTAARSVLKYDQVAANKLAVAMKKLLDTTVPGVYAVNERLAPMSGRAGN